MAADTSGLRDRVRSWGIDIATTAGQLVLDDIAATAPKDTGAMIEGTKITSVEIGETVVSLTVEASAEYASFQEDGTGIYGPRGERIYPTNARALVFNWKKAGGRLVAFASVKGTPATHWFSKPLARWSQRLGEAARTVTG